MFRNTLFILQRHEKCVFNTNVRYLRGRPTITIPIKMVREIEKKIPERDRFSFNEKEFKKLRKKNPGIAGAYRSKVENKMPIDFDSENPDEFGDYEFLASPSNIYDESREKALKKYRRGAFESMKRKVFNIPRLPNMLTFVEKQQIRYLHAKDPEEWTIEKLADSFPATPEIIKKIIKSLFVLTDVDSILGHDESVRKNWKLFEENKLDISDELKEIYSKFVGRLNLQMTEKEISKYVPPPPDFKSYLKKTEFGNIISSSKKFRELQKERDQIQKDEEGREVMGKIVAEMKIIDEDEHKAVYRNRHFTLDKFRKGSEKLKPEFIDDLIRGLEPQKQLEAGPSQVPKMEKETTTKVSKRLERDDGEIEEVSPTEYLNDATAVSSRDYNLEVLLNYDRKNDQSRLERIHIPQALRKTGKHVQLYRVKDCFYDRYGYFVYRVPGLFN